LKKEMKKTVKVISYEDLTAEEKEDVSNNGSGKEYAGYILIEDKDGRRIYSDAMEPEDCTFSRNLSWILDELRK